MLKVRLQRVGKRNDPSFRVVVTDSQNAAKSGKFLEVVGSYDPRKNSKQIDKDRIKHWISVGAQVSDTVHNILVTEKVIDGKKINVLSKKTPIKKDTAEEEKAASKPEDTAKISEPKAEAEESIAVDEVTSDTEAAPDDAEAKDNSAEEEVSKEKTEESKDVEKPE